MANSDTTGTTVTTDTNPPTVQLANTSMFQLTPIYTNPADGNLVFGLRVQYVPQTSDRVINVTMASAGRPDTLSAWYQGDPALWWLINDLTCAATSNNSTTTIDPILDYQPGLQVRFSPTGLNR